jgi:hypothetical protein
MTVGGGILRASNEGGHLVLADPSGRTAKVSGLVFKGPVTICHRIDAVLMWDEWIGPPAGGCDQDVGAS